MIFSDVRVKEVVSTVHYSPQTMRFGSKRRANYIIGIQLTGVADHFFSDRSFTLEPNCLYFFHQEEGYDVEILERGIAFSVHFTTFVPIEQSSFCIKIKDQSNVVRLLDRIDYQYRLHPTTNAKILSGLYALFSLYDEIYSKKYHPSDLRLTQAKEYLNLHFKEKNCIAKAAQQYGVTQRRFNDIFRDNYHITPNQYLLNNKITTAKRLLQVEELSVSDVAELCGFSTLYYFSKTFTDRVGQTPSGFRKELAREDLPLDKPAEKKYNIE